MAVLWNDSVVYVQRFCRVVPYKYATARRCLLSQRRAGQGG